MGVKIVLQRNGYDTTKLAYVLTIDEDQAQISPTGT
jgi:hypothetical protein